MLRLFETLLWLILTTSRPECLPLIPLSQVYNPGTTLQGNEYHLPTSPPGYFSLAQFTIDMPYIDNTKLDQRLILSFEAEPAEDGQIGAVYWGYKPDQAIHSSWVFDLDYHYYETDFSDFAGYPGQHIGIDFANTGYSDIRLKNLCVFVADRLVQVPR